MTALRWFTFSLLVVAGVVCGKWLSEKLKDTIASTMMGFIPSSVVSMSMQIS